MKEMIVEAKTKKLDEVLLFLEDFLEEADASQKIRVPLAIALEEMFVNIASYAYVNTDVPEKERTAKIGLALVGKSGEERILVMLTDHGIPYDPLAKEDPDITLPAEERQIGGLGIYMVKKSMDAVSYERRDGENVFTMEKSLADKDEGKENEDGRSRNPDGTIC